MRELWSKYRSVIIQNCTEEETDPTRLAYWQNYLFASSILYILPLSFIALVPGIYMAYLYRLEGLLFVDFLAISTIVIVAFTPRMSVFIRKSAFNTVLYITSVTLLVYLGSLGPGLLYLLGVTIFIVLSMDKIYAYAAAGTNTIICILVGYSIYADFASPVIDNVYTLGSWVAVSSNLIVLSAASVLLIPILYDGLRATLVMESQLRSDLEKEQHWLKLLESAVANTTEAIVILDVDHTRGNDRRILYVNDSFEEMTGYKKDEVLGGTYDLLKYSDSNESVQERQYLMRALDSGETCEAEFKTHKKNGDTYWVHVSFAPLKNSEGESTYWIVVSRDVSERRNRVKQLRESLAEKETLLMEIHHRVKNNLAVVSSMIQLQALGEVNDATQKKLFDSIVRIRTIASIHELLYESGSFTKLNLTQNLKKLATMITDTIQNDQEINVEYHCDEIELNVNQAIPASLIVNEVMTNSIKHAFAERKKGNLFLKIEKKPGAHVSIQLRDDGKGISADFNKEKTTLGMQLIQVLSEQMHAEYRYEKAPEGGTVFELQFKKNEVKGIGNAYL